MGIPADWFDENLISNFYHFVIPQDSVDGEVTMVSQEALNSTEMKGRVRSLAAELQESRLTEFGMGIRAAEAFRSAGACNADVLATEYNEFAASPEKHPGYGSLPQIELVYAGESDGQHVMNIMKEKRGPLGTVKTPLALNVKVSDCATK